jgi:hypothetical protein
MQIVSPSRATSEPPFEVRGGLGVGAMLSHQRDDYGTSYLLEVHPALRVHDSLAAELALSSWSFPDEGTTGRVTLWGAGLRLDPRLSPRLRLFADLHVGLGATGGNTRFLFDGGGGLACAVTDLLSIGLFARYGQLVDSRDDPKFAAGGAFLGLAWPGETAAPALSAPPPSAMVAPAGSGGSAVGGMPDAAVLLPPDAGVSDGMMADRDAAPDSANSQ